MAVQAVDWTIESMDSQGKDKQVKKVNPGPILHSVLQVC